MFILFGGMFLGQMVVEEIVTNAPEQLYANTASISMLIVSFFVAIVAWQGLGVLSVLMWVLLKLITFRLGKAEAPTQKIMPPHAWKMIPYAALTCAIYGAVIGVANTEVPLIVILDFGIAGAAWGVLLNILAKFRLLPYVDFRDTLNEMAIENAIEDAHVAAHNVELEITEGVLMIGQTYIDEALVGLNKLGIKLSMDDFGTGYSSLSYLRLYPFDVLKIDRSFVDGITKNKADLDLVKATISMAHSLDLTVVAEGVEIKEQAQLLNDLKCDCLQGYYFSRPVTANALLEYSANYQ